MNQGQDFVLLLLNLARGSHEMLQAGQDIPPLPSFNELAALEDEIGP
jgi:hypothetical protein